MMGCLVKRKGRSVVESEGSESVSEEKGQDGIKVMQHNR